MHRQGRGCCAGAGADHGCGERRQDRCLHGQFAVGCQRLVRHGDGNENAARLSGINIQKIKTIVYTLAGVLAALGGLMVTARLDSAQPNAGTGYELDAIAAVVIGGTSLSGGRGSIWGTVLGAIIIGVLNNGLVLLNVSPFWQQVVKGFVILLAVIIDKMNQKKD